MKYSPLDKGATDSTDVAIPATTRTSLWARFKGLVRQFKRDLREPLPHAAELNRWGRVRARFKHLFKRYGWKLLVAIFVYYLIRDGLLYIVIPYFVARKLLG